MATKNTALKAANRISFDFSVVISLLCFLGAYIDDRWFGLKFRLTYGTILLLLSFISFVPWLVGSGLLSLYLQERPWKLSLAAKNFLVSAGLSLAYFLLFFTLTNAFFVMVARFSNS